MAKDKRKAIKCELERKSDSNPGYYKYNVTIKEKDGTIHKQPAYGVDMQDALSRLIKNEITVKVENKLSKNVGWVFVLWLAIFGWPAAFNMNNSPWFLLYSIGTCAALFGIAAVWYNHIHKGE